MPKKNETAVITGASSGIGAAIALKYSLEGYDVLLFGRDEKKLKLVQEKCLGQTEVLAFDLKTIKKNTEKIEEKLKSLSPLTVLINNAGIYHWQSFADTPDEVWEEQFQVNLLSAVQLTKIAWPHFKKNKRGSIINISSTLGVKPAPNTSAYSSIKAAMVNWTLNLAQEGGEHQIRANCICPGIVDTPIHAFHRLNAEEKLQKTAPLIEMQLLKTLGQPNDVAEAAYFLGSDLSKWTTGSIFHIDGGIHIK